MLFFCTLKGLVETTIAAFQRPIINFLALHLTGLAGYDPREVPGDSYESRIKHHYYIPNAALGGLLPHEATSAPFNWRARIDIMTGQLLHADRFHAPMTNSTLSYAVGSVVYQGACRDWSANQLV